MDSYQNFGFQFTYTVIILTILVKKFYHRNVCSLNITVFHRVPIIYETNSLLVRMMFLQQNISFDQNSYYAIGPYHRWNIIFGWLFLKSLVTITTPVLKSTVLLLCHAQVHVLKFITIYTMEIFIYLLLFLFICKLQRPKLEIGICPRWINQVHFITKHELSENNTENDI